jgi:hypothetical protein
MASITDIILDDTNALTAADWDFDPNAGTGAMLDEIDAPSDFDSAAVTFSPYI